MWTFLKIAFFCASLISVADTAVKFCQKAEVYRADEARYWDGINAIATGNWADVSDADDARRKSMREASRLAGELGVKVFEIQYKGAARIAR